jgi:hypothetical protein
MYMSAVRVYKVEGYLDFVADALYDTLANHCKKDYRIARPFGGMNFWFKVSEKKHKDRHIIKADGGMDKCRFAFRSDGKNSFFTADHFKDTEDTFRQFAYLMNFHRRDLDLEPINFDSLYEIAEEDSPAVGADNYALFDAVDTGALQDILNKEYVSKAHREFSGKYSVTVYSENAVATKHFYEKNIPVCQKFLGAFEEFYGYKDAMLVCARRGKEQHVYFYVKGKGIFYNREDLSKAFLKQEDKTLTLILSTSFKKMKRVAVNREEIKKRIELGPKSKVQVIKSKEQEANSKEQKKTG